MQLVIVILWLPHFGQSLIVSVSTFWCFKPLITSRKSASFPIVCLSKLGYCTSTFDSGYPSRIRYVLTLSLWSP